MMASIWTLATWGRLPGTSPAASASALRVSNALTDAQRQETAQGDPLSYGAPGIQTTEMMVEANYNIAAWRGVGIMPDVQWIIRPSASTHNGNALVLGLQVKVRF